jgi:hypothetical protein
MVRKVILLCGVLLVVGVSSAFAVTPIDLTTLGASVTAAGATWNELISVPTGTGNYQPFERLQANGTEEGFNNDLNPSPLDTDHAWTTSLALSSLQAVNGYYVFNLDINETNSDADHLLSLDRFQLFTASTANISGTYADLAGAASLRYDMDAGGDYTVYLDHTLQAGSGHDDMELLIPVTYFAGAAPSDFVYLYSQFGLQGGSYSTSDGFEEWKALRGLNAPPPPDDVPEPSAMLMLGGGLVGLLGIKRRKK